LWLRDAITVSVHIEKEGILVLRQLAVLGAAGVALAVGPLQGIANADVHAFSASGCTGNPGSNGSTCISVKGHGLHVDKVKTTFTKNHLDGCESYKVSFSRGGHTNPTGGDCDARDLSSGWIKEGFNFPNHTKVCGKWTYSGSNRACVTVHK
jgi:hypothetical protein